MAPIKPVETDLPYATVARPVRTRKRATGPNPFEGFTLGQKPTDENARTFNYHVLKADGETYAVSQAKADARVQRLIRADQKEDYGTAFAVVYTDNGLTVTYWAKSRNASKVKAAKAEAAKVEAAK